jgi:hypothetical protein
MTSTPGEKVDPAHWISMGGGAIMFVAVVLCSLALWMPWWTMAVNVPGRKENTDVTLWIRYTRMELEADESTLDCDKQCDYTRIGSAKVREEEMSWADACAAQDGAAAGVEGRGMPSALAGNCSKLWVVRVFVLLCWFMALLYVVFSTFNLCGAGLPSAHRMPAIIKMLLALGCIMFACVALLTAALVTIRLQPIPPGTEPAWEVHTSEVLGLNGVGFLSVVISLLLSLLGMGLAYFSQVVINHQDRVQDMEGGRPLADVNRGRPPSVEHQVGGAVGKHAGEETPRPTKIGSSNGPKIQSDDEFLRQISDMSIPRTGSKPLGSWMKGR